MKYGIFTIIAKNYLAYARVLMNSIREFAPEAQRFVILVDHVEGLFDPSGEPFELIRSEELDLPEPHWFHFKYTILELSTAVKPYAAEFLLHRFQLDRLLFFDPDICCYSPLGKLWDMLDHADIVLTPHLTRTLDDGNHPGDLDILRAGTYNLGFIGLKRSTTTFEFLDWWRAKLYEHCVVDLAHGLFVDQRWIDLAPAIFDGVSINREPGYNVAYWNLKHRAIDHRGGRYVVNGQPLYFFHFSGFDPENPSQFSKHQNRYRLEDLPAVTLRLIDAYRRRILEAGFLESRKWPYSYGNFANGLPVPDMGRPSHHESPELMRTVSDPFSDNGYQAFLKLWNEPVVSGNGERLGVTRLAYRIYRSRSDVQSVMPDVLGADRIRFLEWFVSSGRREHCLDNAFLAPVWDALSAARRHARNGGREVQNPFRRSQLSPRAAEAVRQANGLWLKTEAADLANGLNDMIRNGHAGIQLTRLARAIYESRIDLQRRMPDPCGRDAVAFLTWFLTYGKREYDLNEVYLDPLRGQWHVLLNGQTSSWDRWRHGAIMVGMEWGLQIRSALGSMRARAQLQRAFGSLRNGAESHQPSAAKPAVIRTGEFGVNVVGHLDAETGVGESARVQLLAAQAAGIPVHATSLRVQGAYRRSGEQLKLPSDGPIYGSSVFHVNADETPSIFESEAVSDFAGGYNIGYWAWELEEFPDRFLPSYAYYREIWTPSSFCQAAIARKSPIPVICIPHAVLVERPEGLGREHFGLRPDEVVFLNLFDMLSIFERKNPIGVVRAFVRAFGNDTGKRLVIKVNHAEQGLAEMERLAKAAQGANVTVLTGPMSRREIAGLIGSCDCLVSLHRSEGFGFTMAEAMHAAKPVIATRYSGNLDFTLADNSLTVAYKLCRVGAGCDPYPADAMWADPDEEHAARHMRDIAADAQLRIKLGALGRKTVVDTLSPAAVGKRIRERMEQVRARQSSMTQAAVSAG